jgi:hypothetical protein
MRQQSQFQNQQTQQIPPCFLSHGHVIGDVGWRLVAALWLVRFYELASLTRVKLSKLLKQSFADWFRSDRVSIPLAGDFVNYTNRFKQ